MVRKIKEYKIFYKIPGYNDIVYCFADARNRGKKYVKGRRCQFSSEHSNIWTIANMKAWGNIEITRKQAEKMIPCLPKYQIS